MESIGALIGLIIIGAVYFLPSIVAFNRTHINRIPILVLNFLLGWTLLGWVVSLIWALTGFTLESKIKYSNPATELEKLHELKEKGIITEQEFESKKREILNS